MKHTVNGVEVKPDANRLINIHFEATEVRHVLGRCPVCGSAVYRVVGGSNMAFSECPPSCPQELAPGND